MIFSNRYAREAAGFSAVKVSRLLKGLLLADHLAAGCNNFAHPQRR
jgi:hypothetical protein